MKIYISSSWKNRDRVRALAVLLRAAGHEVYDFTDPGCRQGVPEVPPEQFPEQFDPKKHVYRDYLDVPLWRAAVECNRRALKWCEACVLLLPAGCDSHADWVLAVGLGKITCVVGHPVAEERTPSHHWADDLLLNDEEVPPWANTWNHLLERADHYLSRLSWRKDQ